MGYYDQRAIHDALALVGLSNLDKKPVKHYSLGMRQRLGIARAISTRPELLILDEPINGMDPAGIRELRELFRALCKEQGITLFISSHILQEIELLADTIGVIRNGRLLKEVSMAHVRELHNEYIEIEVSDVKQAVLIVEDAFPAVNYKVMEHEVIRIYGGVASPAAINRLLIERGIEVASLSKKSRSLEDYFLDVMKGANGDAEEAHRAGN
jgi:ABC-2 type transport system ATP-binding protein